MDKISRALLAAAIAILFPLLVYFTANTFLPDKTSIRTQNYSYDYDCGDNLGGGACYQPEYNNYSSRSGDEERGVMRAGLAISLALVGIVGALGARRIHELLAGLTVGGAVTIFGAISYLSTVKDPGSEPVYQFVFWMAVFAFLALLTILYTADNSLPRPKIVPAKPTPKKQ